MIESLKLILESCEEDPIEFFSKNDILTIKTKCHPDRWLDNQEEAKNIFERFVQLYEESKTVRVHEGYILVKKIAEGDISTVYRGQKTDKFLVKIPKIKNNLLKKEFEICQSLTDATIYSNFIPYPIEYINGTSVYKWQDNLVSGSRIASLPKLDSRHVIWMFKRILMVLGYIHSKDTVHGAITPDHLLFNKDNHGLLLCGWIHSGKINDDIKVVPGKWKHYYENVKKTKKLTRQLDIYMAAKSMLDIGKNIQPRLKRFIESCMLPGNMAPSDAWEIHDDLNSLAIGLFGNSKFIKLEI